MSIQNDKYGSNQARRVKVAISGSSNGLLALDQSDRRYLCLEPAHMDGTIPATTEPLTYEEATRLDMLLGSEYDDSRYDDEIQEFANHLCWINSEAMSTTMYNYLYREAPETPYRTKWVGTGLNNVRSIVANLNSPKALVDSVHTERAVELPHMLQYVIEMYNEESNKCALSWRWFNEMAGMVAADEHISMSKTNLSRALGYITFSHGSSWAVENHLISSKREWPQDMYTFTMTARAIREYKQCLEELTDTTRYELD
jgi:hypothetical protein